MKNRRILSIVAVLCIVVLTSCESNTIGIIGGADGPTAIYVSEGENGQTTAEDDAFIRQNYLNAAQFPNTDASWEKHTVSDDRLLVLEDEIENEAESFVYQWYRNQTLGNWQEMYKVIHSDSLLAATEADENMFADGIWYSKIVLEELEVVNSEDVQEMPDNGKRSLVSVLKRENITAFTLVKAECDVTWNDKGSRAGMQVPDGEVTRYYLIGRTEDGLQMCEVFWEGLLG